MYKTLEKYIILTFCFLGSFVRLLYGYYYEPWTYSPNQLAWELILEHGHFSYSHLIHYPHEGGTILISILSHFIKLFTDFSSLTISAFIIDFIIRFIQITIVKKIFNNKVTYLFGIWTIFANPTIIPWGTSNFGLHHISSVFPFILLYILFKNKYTVNYQMFCGFFLGLALWFSYSNLILIPAFFLYCIIKQIEFKKWGFAILSLMVVLICHLFVRQYMDAGFQLDGFESTSIRGEVFSFGEINIWQRLINIPKVIINSVAGLPKPIFLLKGIKITFILVCILASIGLLMAYWRANSSQTYYIISPIIFFFFTAYLFGPFYYSGYTGDHVSFRHFTYIAPMVLLIIVIGFSSLKYKIIPILFISLNIYHSSKLFSLEKKPKREITTKATGWLLASKLGHEYQLLNSIVEKNPKEANLLIQGIGWGTSTSLMKESDVLAKSVLDTKINKLIELLSKYPEAYQTQLLKGIEFSFSDQVSPQLDKKLLVTIKESLNKRHKIKPD